MKENLVVIGNGMAAGHLVEELLSLAPSRHRITIFGAERFDNYNRVLLTSVLSGEKSASDIVLKGADWYRERNVTLHLGKEVVAVNRAKRIVIADDGTSLAYDRLVFATGARPVTPLFRGADLPGVFTIRNITDVEKLLRQGGRAGVVVGGGVLGLETAYALFRRGMEVTVVHRRPVLMANQTDPVSGEMLKSSLEKCGVRVLTGRDIASLKPEEAGYNLTLEGGGSLHADLVVFAAGTKPETELARKSGIQTESGIVVSDTMLTSDPLVYAIGGCAQHRNKVYGQVAPSFEMARVCADHLAGLGHRSFKGFTESTRLKVKGIELYVAGDISPAGNSEVLTVHDAASGIYKKIALVKGRIAGFILLGDVGEAQWLYRLTNEKRDISNIRKRLLYGDTVGGDPAGEKIRAAAQMPDNALVCGCNGIRKGEIVKAIQQKGLLTLDDVKKHTKAGASCGSCSGLVEQILILVAGENYSSPARKPLCGCTDLEHDEVKAAIRENFLTSIQASMSFMKWKTPDGCPACRPALNYYCQVFWPEAVADDPLSRLVNERIHANIQKDGTFSVIPRIYGGVATPSDLRAIAATAEKFAVETVKITGGQRIGLFGLRKEQLPGVWSDLAREGLGSGHAYAKGLRTVKTCVGETWCRFGTQDSMELGIRIEKAAYGTWTPAKVKLAVSGCPRNCAEATIKDIGVIAVSSGWEIYFGGNGGVKVRVTDLVCQATSMDEASEFVLALLQLYREEARYGERTAHWVERAGLEHIREKVVRDAQNRSRLVNRFTISQKMRKDPWSAVIAGAGIANEYETWEAIK